MAGRFLRVLDWSHPCSRDEDTSFRNSTPFNIKVNLREARLSWREQAECEDAFHSFTNPRWFLPAIKLQIKSCRHISQNLTHPLCLPQHQIPEARLSWWNLFHAALDWTHMKYAQFGEKLTDLLIHHGKTAGAHGWRPSTPNEGGFVPHYCVKESCKEQTVIKHGGTTELPWDACTSSSNKRPFSFKCATWKMEKCELFCHIKPIWRDVWK